jgi:UDP-N-acetylmuramyl pentapeptide phosphotransferase/UDP-N-acetylglucosamine-1-phosphate transferase
VFAAIVTVAVMPMVLAGLQRRRVVDVPNERSSHDRPVLRAGGIAPAIACLVALFATPALSGHARAALLGGASAFGVVGLFDDLRGIRATLRLALQFGIAVALLPFLIDGMTGSVLWRAVFAAGVVTWLVAYVNAFNFMDGINGISAAQAIIAGSTWFAIGVWRGVPSFAAVGAIVCGAAVGFAPFNFPTARVFLGDVGSYFLGAWLAVGVVLGLRSGLAAEAVIAPLTIYLVDTATTLVQRVRRGEHWWQPHHDHTYQRLYAQGWSHTKTTVVIGGLLVAIGASGAFTADTDRPTRLVIDLVIAGLLVAYLSAPRLIDRRTAVAR